MACRRWYQRHDWSTWTNTLIGVSFPILGPQWGAETEEVGQQRTCARCGRTELRTLA